MLVLTFEAARGRYALPTRCVVEVVPWIDVQPVAQAPAGVAGYFSHRGRVTPVLDLGRLAGGEPCRPLYSSRLILVRALGERLVGLLAERVATAHLPDDDPGESAGGWGPLLLDAGGVVQLVRPERLLTADLLAVLFPA